MKRNFERHLERHVAGGPRRCTICSYSSTGEGAIQRHMAEYHPPSPPPTAASPAAESSPEDRRKFDVQATSSVLLFQPTKNPSTTTTTTAAAAAPTLGKLPIISCDVTGRWTCPLCPLSYKRPADLNRHTKQKHYVALKDFAVASRSPVVATTAAVPSPPDTLHAPFPVPVADSSADQPLNLSLKETAVDLPRPEAAVNLTVIQTEPLDLSVIGRRSDEISAARTAKTAFGYPCSQCTYVSKRASDLRRHQLVHCSSKRYRCPYCVGDRSYKLQFDLGRHMAKVHGKVGGTQQGDAMEIKSKVAGVSQSVATGNTVPEVAAAGNSMACPYCQYVGKNSNELERHARLHNGEKPHRCPCCSFQTVWKTDLTRHVQMVHGQHGVVANSESGSAGIKPEVDYNMNVDDARTRSPGCGTRIWNFIADVSQK